MIVELLLLPEISDYFLSIERPFRAKAERLSRTSYPDMVSFAFIFSLLFFGITAVISSVSVSSFIFHANEISFLGQQVSFSGLHRLSILILFASFVMTMVGIMVGDSLQRRIVHKGLGQAQMRFAICYALVEELKFYEKNGLDQHLHHAKQLWFLLFGYLQGMLSPFGKMPSSFSVPRKEDVYGIRILKWSSALPWVKLDDSTMMIMDAFDNLPSNVTGRLIDGHQVQELAAIFSSLTTYLYSALMVKSNPAIADTGSQSLLNFSQSLIHLGPYRSIRYSKPGERASGFLNSIRPIVRPFSHQNALIRFLGWYAFASILTFCGIAIMLRFLPLHWDSTLVTAQVTCPPLVAITAMALRKN